jgi:signal peptidase I
VFARKFTRFLIFTAIVIGVLIGIARATAIRWYRVPADDPYLEASVAPTLFAGDLIVLWRFTRPGFGDLVLCPEPKAEQRSVIGRIAGMPGDKVQVKGALLTVNGQNMHSSSACDLPTFTVPDPATRLDTTLTCDREDLAGRLHNRGNPPKDRGMHDSKLTADAGRVVLISDNRYFPYDSRDFGSVPLESCKETIVFRLVSAKGFGDVASRMSLIW